MMQSRSSSVIPGNPAVPALLRYSQRFVSDSSQWCQLSRWLWHTSRYLDPFLFPVMLCVHSYETLYCCKDIAHELKVSVSCGIDTQLENNLNIQCPKCLPGLSHHSMVTYSHFGSFFFSENYFKFSLIIFWSDSVEPLPWTFIFKSLDFFHYNDV